MTADALSRGWAIGTTGWRKAIAREHRHPTLAPEMSANEIAALKAARWLDALSATLAASGRTRADLAATPKGADGKVTIARTLRDTVAPPYGWLAEH